MRTFLSLFPISETTKILDVGGYPSFWEVMPVFPRITLLNMDKAAFARADPSKFGMVLGDARFLPFEDQAFDIGFSNSLLEHLFTFEEQRRAANEIRRVAKRIWVQTPARWFPIETHLNTPFIHYLPIPLRRRLIRNFTVWGLFGRPSREEIAAFLREVRLLSRSEMKQLFPDSQILGESFAGFTKSYIAVK